MNFQRQAPILKMMVVMLTLLPTVLRPFHYKKTAIIILKITTWYNGHDYKGYIDFNNDGDFLDPNEEVFSGANPPNIKWSKWN